MGDGRVEMEEGRGNLPAVRHGMGDGRWEMGDGRVEMEAGTCLPSGMGWKRLYEWLRNSLIRSSFFRLDLCWWQ